MIIAPYPGSLTYRFRNAIAAIFRRIVSLSLCVTVGIWLLNPPGISTNPVDILSLPIAAAQTTSASHQRPIPGVVLSPANIPPQRWLPGHRGVDLKAQPGDLIRASAPGVVHFAGVVAGTPTLSIAHDSGLRTTYEPVVARVKVGEQVAQGAIVGVLADSSTLPDTARREHGLHWGAIVRDETDEQYIDPMTLLATRKVRLWQ